MTQLLQQALDALSRLAPVNQDSIAAIILDELADERRWDESFARSQHQLAKLAEKARADIADGRVINKGVDKLSK
jgi:hypothetical protein